MPATAAVPPRAAGMSRRQFHWLRRHRPEVLRTRQPCPRCETHRTPGGILCAHCCDALDLDT